jgi:hypothetical protein
MSRDSLEHTLDYASDLYIGLVFKRLPQRQHLSVYELGTNEHKSVSLYTLIVFTEDDGHFDQGRAAPVAPVRCMSVQQCSAPAIESA